jgi:protein-arginine kinase activator protein McsA
MNEYYNSLLVDLEDIKEKKTKKELEFEFNLRLKIALQNENYEEASRIRDYMKKNKIKKNF